ncbi:MAG: T9SS type A sorting domain-containing protein [Bacteroidetes bacterium]|nr:T9SS type A sorting domain-containing protein [Bacteroidota bacterium]
MRIKFLYFFLLCASITTAQPSYEWARNHAFSLNSYGWCVSHSLNKDLIVSGSFTGPFNDPDSTDMGGFIIKYDSTGNLKWQKTYYSINGAIRTLNAVDKNGNIYITGWFGGIMQFDGNALTGGGMYFIKYSPNGNLLFSKHITTIATPYEICINSNNEILISGLCWPDSLFEGNVMHKDGFIAKYSSSGNFIWVKDFFLPITSENNYDMCLDSTGNIFLTGDFSGNPFITDSVQILSTGTRDGFIAKYDSEANLKWVKTIKGPGYEVPKCITINNDKEIFVSGYYGSYSGTTLALFDSISIASTVNNDIFICKYDSSGNCKWVKMAGSDGIDAAREIYADDSNVFITGYFGKYGQGNCNFEGQILNSTSGYTPDMFLANYDTDGNLKWVKGSYGGGGHGIDLTGNGRDLYLTGAFGGNFTFGDFSLTGNVDQVFVMKVKYDTIQTILTVPEKLYNDTELFTICPNPSQGIFVLKYMSIEKSSLQINISDIKGQIISRSNIPRVEGSYCKEIDLSRQAKGVYFIEIITDKNRQVKRVVLE